ncbi:MAG: aminopeptidase [Phycisphaerales bacterium]|nr:aminopeptidase [Phycisphaerales bacterium]
MRDQRLDKLASVLVNYSAGVKPGDLVRISGEAVGLPLAEAIYEHVLVAGGNPFVSLLSDAMEEAFYRVASQQQLEYVSPISQFIVENINVSIGLWADENTKSMTHVDPKKQAAAAQARKPISRRFLERAAKGELRWVGTQFPTQASAQDAEMSLREYEDFVFSGGLLHLPDPVAAWKRISETQQRLVDFLDHAKEVRVVGRDTDLRLGVQGRKWINCCGHENFPDGEVFTGPIEDAVNGRIRYSFPAVHHGRECHDIELVFKNGKVVDAKASKGQDFLLAMIEQDVGAKTLGEFAIGTNFSIQQYTKNTLFDEKIGGTCHAALGAAYPETGGKNDSGLHWDMVCDLRHPGCRIEVDGQTILEAGRFVRPEWPKPD